MKHVWEGIALILYRVRKAYSGIDRRDSTELGVAIP